MKGGYWLFGLAVLAGFITRWLLRRGPPLARRAPAFEAAPPVLLVGDDFELVEICRELIDSQGFTVLTAASLGDALAEFRARRPQVVILINLLGYLDDLRGFLARLSEFSEEGRAPVLFCTGLKMRPDQVPGFVPGHDDFLKKPVGRGRFLSQVERFIRRAPPPLPDATRLSPGRPYTRRDGSL